MLQTIEKKTRAHLKLLDLMSSHRGISQPRAHAYRWQGGRPDGKGGGGKGGQGTAPAGGQGGAAGAVAPQGGGGGGKGAHHR